MAVILKSTLAREEMHLIDSHENLMYRSLCACGGSKVIVIPAQVLLRVPKDNCQSCAGELL